MKSASYRRTNIVRFHAHEAPRTVKLRKQKGEGWLAGAEGRELLSMRVDFQSSKRTKL